MRISLQSALEQGYTLSDAQALFFKRVGNLVRKNRKGRKVEVKETVVVLSEFKCIVMWDVKVNDLPFHEWYHSLFLPKGYAYVGNTFKKDKEKTLNELKYPRARFHSPTYALDGEYLPDMVAIYVPKEDVR